MKFDISIVIVNYNTGKYLFNCICSIFQSNPSLKLEIIIIDNDSSDDSIEFLNSYKQNFTLIKNKSNLGFSKALNLGLRKSSAKYVCILNPDTLCDQNSMQKMFDYMEKSLDVACLSPKIVNSDGSFQISCKRSLPTIKNSFFKITGIDKLFPSSSFFGSYNLLYLDENEINQVEVISGACMFMRYEVLKLVGYFDESFFMYGEDIDYCHRINEAGLKILYYPDSKVVHFKGVSAESRPYEVISEFHNSMIKYYDKYQLKYPFWKLSKIFIVSIIIVKKYLSYFIHFVRNRVK
ncbi:MAG: glycosyl transferase family 2 [Candidatus Marinimicrobia bacterium]|nr:glycosyl transferase family 2 [Candidatus Neomarinimicrobiota bacterium]